MVLNPPRQFESFCVGFDVALCRDTSRISQDDYDVSFDEAIDYGLEGYDQNDLVNLRNFLSSVLQGPEPAQELEKLWKASRSRIVFFSGPDARADQPAIVQVFTRVLKATEKKLS
jgi:hypothetical protein